MNTIQVSNISVTHAKVKAKSVNNVLANNISATQTQVKLNGVNEVSNILAMQTHITRSEWSMHKVSNISAA